jgi:head-tail adaptor
MAMPTAGDLRHTVAIQELPEVPEVDEFGQPKRTEDQWSTITTRRACIQDVVGSESWQRRQVVADANVLVKLRYVPKLALWRDGEHVGPQMRLVEMVKGAARRVLNIRAVVNPDKWGRKIFLEVHCKA